MDKAWMSKYIFSREYLEGVQDFLKFALQNATNPDQIRCPCAICKNVLKTNSFTIKIHLEANGVDRTYHTWIFHGEKEEISTTVLERDETWKTNPVSIEKEDDPVTMVDDAYNICQDNPTQFRELLEDAETPLYPSSMKFTKLSALVKLYNLKAKYGWSDISFTALLSLLGEMLPDGNELPLSLYSAKKTLRAVGLTYQKIHACPNDCVLYRKEYKDYTSCPSCGLSRWKEIGKTKELNVGIPSKVLWYLSPIPRFLRMYRNKEIAKELTWHAEGRNCDGKLRHPADAPAWKLVDHKWPNFSLEHRNLRLALSADGINPHSTMSSKYSCWPVLLVNYNLPPWLCMKRKFMMLTLLISGPRQPGNDIDVYLSPLIDDLKELWENGIEAYDGYRKESFLLKAVLLWTINDFPAYGNLSGCSVKGYYACPVCCEGTCSKWLKHSRKMSYTGHRRFLPRHHPYRRQKKAFDGEQDFNLAPKPLTGSEILNKVRNIKCVWGDTKAKKMKEKESKVLGKSCRKKKAKKKSKGDEKLNLTEDEAAENPCFKKKSIFYNLEYWEHLHVRHILDVMHIEKNVCESLIGTLLDIPGKTKDGIAARLDLVEMGVRTQLAPNVGEKRTFLPPACHTLSKEEKRKLCTSLMGVKVPMGYSSNIANLVSIEDLKLGGLKSHDYHTLMQQLLPVAIRGILPKHVRYTITRLCSFFNVLCDKVIDVPKLEELQIHVVTTLCLLEKEFPPSFFDIMVHLVVHLVREVKLCGPVWYRWMYPFERFMGILKGYVRNRYRPEGCIVECYIAEEAVEFCAHHLSNVSTIGIPARTRLTKPLSSAECRTINDEELDQAHLYVLNNDNDFDQYIEEHKAELKSLFPTKSRSEMWIQQEHNRSFIGWLRDRLGHTSSIHSSATHQISKKLKWMSNGPSKTVLTYQSYMVNGVTYHTKERDRLRAVQNSGVSIVAKTMQVASAKDKNPIVSDMVFYGIVSEIWELDYNVIRVVMFKCDWIDSNFVKVDDLDFTLVNLNRIGYKNDSFILGSQAKQVFYIEDPQDCTLSVVLECPKQDYSEMDSELEEVLLNRQGVTKGIPTTNLNDEVDENELSCVREDCNGLWVNNAQY